MPDWLTTEVRISGPNNDIARFRAAHISKDENGEDRLDFNRIIPMPCVLEHTQAGGAIDALIWVLGGELYASRGVLRKSGLPTADYTPLDYPWLQKLGITTREGLLSWARKERPYEVDAARRALEIERAIGYRSWYDWQVENWGCNLGCYEFMWQSEDKTAFLIDTPWSHQCKSSISSLRCTPR